MCKIEQSPIQKHASLINVGHAIRESGKVLDVVPFSRRRFLPASRIGGQTCAVLALLLLNGSAGRLFAQDRISIAEIVEQMAQNDIARAQELKNYTSTRTYKLHNLRFHKTAEMTVKLTYTSPGRKAFEVLSESGPRPVRDKVLRRMVESEAEASGDELRQLNRITPQNYDFRLLREDRESGRIAYVLEAIPKTKSKYLMKGEVWVDAQDFAISRVSAQPAKSPSFWIRNSRFEYRYAKFGSFWLPVSTDSEADAVVFGHTEVKIRYEDYRINSEQGLSRSGLAPASPVPPVTPDAPVLGLR